jgi:septal ring factor EnvC (AmiA/AmiB activator)
MNDILASTNPKELSSNRKTRSERRSSPGTLRRTATYFLLTIILWCGLAYGGYTLAQEHINRLRNHQAEIETALKTRIEEVQEENRAKIDSLNSEMTGLTAKLEDVSAKLETIREELQLTSDSISGSDDTKLALQAQISALNKQLDDLKKSLEKLENAARVY